MGALRPAGRPPQPEATGFFSLRKKKEETPSIICVGCEQRVPLWDEMELCFASPEIAASVMHQGGRLTPFPTRAGAGATARKSSRSSAFPGLAYLRPLACNFRIRIKWLNPAITARLQMRTWNAAALGMLAAGAAFVIGRTSMRLLQNSNNSPSSPKPTLCWRKTKNCRM